ncbi:AarF/UbiB family protein [Streptosporangium canum]|uniref:AarF/UbiB family protein n=1 Tax=Streptosporangium canum TaxID=324952 RepID=UPI00342E55C5
MSAAVRTGETGGTHDEPREELAKTLLALLLRQIMLHGLFHAGPHPGNVMLLADGRTAGTRQEGRRTRDRLPRPLPGRCAGQPPGPRPRGRRRREPEVCLGGRG